MSDSEAETLIPGLPNDVALNCLARVPRRYHGVLSAASKPIKTLLSSPEFFAARSRLGVSEELLCLRLRSPLEIDTTVFSVVHRNPTRLAPLRPPPGGHREDSAVASMGHSIYLIGGQVSNFPSTDVWVLDCRTGTWSRGPATLAPRRYAHAVVLEGRIYLLEGGEPFAEVLEPESGRWEALPDPGEDALRVGGRVWVAVAGKVRLLNEWSDVAFDPETWSWTASLFPQDHQGQVAYTGLDASWWALRSHSDRLEVDGQIRSLFMFPKKMVLPGGRVVMLAGGLRSPERGNEVYDFEAWCKEIKLEDDGAFSSDTWCKEVLWFEKLLSWSGPQLHTAYGILERSWTCFYVSL